MIYLLLLLLLLCRPFCISFPMRQDLCPPHHFSNYFYLSYSTPVLSPPPLQGRSYGYALPQPYSYYLRENELSNLEKQIKSIEVADEKAHTSPFDTVDVTPVKSTEVCRMSSLMKSRRYLKKLLGIEFFISSINIFDKHRNILLQSLQFLLDAERFTTRIWEVKLE